MCMKTNLIFKKALLKIVGFKALSDLNVFHFWLCPYHDQYFVCMCVSRKWAISLLRKEDRYWMRNRQNPAFLSRLKIITIMLPIH